MRLEIRHIPPMRLAYMRHTGPYGHPGLSDLWERFGQWCAQHRLSEPRPRFYGISHDNPACTPPEACRYDACVQIGLGKRVGTEALVQDFPGGDYACMHFIGTGPEVGAAWAGMHAQGFPPGWEPANRPALEIYAEDFAVDPATGRFPCWLCVPVQRK